MPYYWTNKPVFIKNDKVTESIVNDQEEKEFSFNIQCTEYKDYVLCELPQPTAKALEVGASCFNHYCFTTHLKEDI